MFSHDHCIALPGRIVTYDASTQTADVKICAEKIYNTMKALEFIEERPLLNKVPVHTCYGGGWSITFPIAVGDTCLIIFSQVGYDHWLYLDKDKAGMIGGLPNPDLKRSFSENDPFAIVGFNTIPRAIEGYAEEGSQWRNEDATQSIHLKPDIIEIIDATAVTIKAPAVTVESDAISLTGNTTVTGNLVVTGTLATGPASTDFISHTHSDGGSGAPNP